MWEILEFMFNDRNFMIMITSLLALYIFLQVASIWGDRIVLFITKLFNK